MRTTLDIPKELLLEAMKLSNQKNKTSTIILALEELIRKHKIKEIKNYAGKVEFYQDISQIRKVKNKWEK